MAEIPTTAELKAAFRRCGLWRLGWTFDRAQASFTVAWALRHAAIAARARTPDAPRQADLLAELPPHA